MTKASKTYGSQGKTEGIWRTEDNQELRADADSGENARRSSEGTGTQCLESDREDRPSRDRTADSIGGILDQLIEDARKQLVKSKECIAWYESEAKEFEEKLRRFEKLKEIHEQQLKQQNGDSEEPASSP